MKEQQLLICWFLILACIGFFSGCHLWLIPKKCTVFTKGIIVRIIKESAGRRPVIRYTISNGREIEKISSKKSDTLCYRMGYDMERKHNCMLGFCLLIRLCGTRTSDGI